MTQLKAYRNLSLSLVVLFALGTGFFPMVGDAADYPAPGDFQKGAASWADNCSRCHNMRSAKDLRDDQWISTTFHMRVRAGLTGQESRDILTFLQASNTPMQASASMQPAAVSEPIAGQLDGETIYMQTCIACHGANGKGALPGMPDFTDYKGPISKPESVLIEHATDGFQSPNSTMAMPPKGGNSALTDADMRAVVAYLREMFGSEETR